MSSYRIQQRLRVLFRGKGKIIITFFHRNNCNRNAISPVYDKSTVICICLYRKQFQARRYVVNEYSLIQCYPHLFNNWML